MEEEHPIFSAEGMSVLKEALEDRDGILAQWFEDHPPRPTCAATNKNGKKCPSSCARGTDYCNRHIKLSPFEPTKCTGKLQNGNDCPKWANKNTGFCHIHQNQANK